MVTGGLGVGVAGWERAARVWGGGGGVGCLLLPAREWGFPGGGDAFWRRW